MANPQLEDGYLKIATEIMDALVKTRIPGEARQLLDFIIRKTYGWNKKSDAIALPQIMEATDLSKVHIIRARNKLKTMNLITVTQKGNEKYPTYWFNKHFETWKALPKKVTLPKKVICVTQKGNLPLPKKGPTINTITKDTRTKDKTYVETSIELRLSSYLFNLILKRDEKAKKPDMQEWSVHINRLIRIDKRTWEEIKTVIEWCQNDRFWENNILSTKKLREKFPGLYLKMKSENKSSQPAGIGELKELMTDWKERGLL